MNRLIYLCLFASLLSLGCRRSDVPTGIPACLQTRIDMIKAEGVWNPPAKVYQYRYGGRIVYFIPQHCCDIPSQLLDDQCNTICLPDGGFAGSGDGKCSDFFEKRTEEKLIWEDTRK